VPCEEDGIPSDHTITAPVANRIATFMGKCELILFAHILRIDYVGSEETSSPEMIRHQISDRLSTVYQVRGVTHTCRPDDLYKKYLSKVPILPDDTSLWGFMLTNYYCGCPSLDGNLQSRCKADPYDSRQKEVTPAPAPYSHVTSKPAPPEGDLFCR
jgi:hypothetical protein